MAPQDDNTQDDEIEDSSAPLIEHLAELRTRLIRSVIALLVGITVFFIPIQGDFLAEHVLQFMLGPIEDTLRALGDPSPTLIFTAPQEYLFTLFRISLVFGFALAFPVIGY
ncbi:MAG: twin-arginine translocase subunit TatC, partial [Pseudomonadota bacterium]